jgi:hypothetical protein
MPAYLGSSSATKKSSFLTLPPERAEHDADERDDAVRLDLHEGEEGHFAGQDWRAKVNN